eukprot:1961912-Pyramimonas_sp.AAC.2
MQERLIGSGSDERIALEHVAEAGGRNLTRVRVDFTEGATSAEAMTVQRALTRLFVEPEGPTRFLRELLVDTTDNCWDQWQWCAHATWRTYSESCYFVLRVVL